MGTKNFVGVRLSMEPLESRINLASTTVAYTDVDGDVVRIRAAAPGSAAPPLDLGDLSFQSSGGQLVRL